LLIALWQRSYHETDSFRLPFLSGAKVVSLDSKDAVLYVSASGSGGASLQPYLKYPRKVERDVWETVCQVNSWGFGAFQDLKWINTTTIVLPHWLAVLLTLTVATLPWIKWSPHFSLRTLLLATTFVAAVLGLVVAMR
jgi:hypothetical protein